MRKQFKLTTLDLAEKDERVVLVFGDISVFLFNDFQKRFPDRFYNMGILENTLVSVAAGLSSQGFIPFVHTIAPFVTERSTEQIKVDLGYNRFPANIVSTGATFDYAWDGATHHCWLDLASLRLLPDMEVLQPGTPREVDFLLRAHYANDKSTYLASRTIRILSPSTSNRAAASWFGRPARRPPWSRPGPSWTT